MIPPKKIRHCLDFLYLKWLKLRPCVHTVYWLSGFFGLDFLIFLVVSIN